MRQQQITISLPQDLAHYVNAAPDASSLVAEALHHHRERDLDAVLARQYQEDAEETLRLHLEWAAADADFSE